MGRTLAIGDIHGCDTAFSVLLSQIAPQPDDTIIVLGDVVDRGPNTKRCIELLIDLQRQCRLVFLMGNHEEMMLNAVDGGEWGQSWLIYGGREVVDSYDGNLQNVPESHIEFLRGGLDYYETDAAIFVHANLQIGVPLERQTIGWLRWNHLTGRELPDPSGKWIICGHTRLSDGKPAIMNGWVCIDTAACAGGWLTCLDVDALTVVQTNEAGECRDEVKLADIATNYRPRG